MQKKFLGALGMALVLMTGTMAMPVQVCAKDYQDREVILDTGFVLDTDYTLQLANPSEDISTTESYYYITGSSDPDDPLTCNGEEVADRGIYGSFGIYASLEMGENEFVFENGEDTVSLTITRTEPSTSGGGIATITNLRADGAELGRYCQSRGHLPDSVYSSGQWRGNRHHWRGNLRLGTGSNCHNRCGGLLFHRRSPFPMSPTARWRIWDRSSTN